MKKSVEILEKYWGFTSFRPSQSEIIDDSINGSDVLALLPTGGGKSICFQVPGLVREGITIVVSPLIALMQDQVTNLNKKGIRAKSIISGMSYREIDLILDNARFGGLDFLYTSPERIQSKLFIERCKRMSVGLIVVDEAHCISEWGHDFRPSFLQIKELRVHHPNVPIIALTATATQEVRNDIIKQLQLKNPKIHEASFERKNLTYNCYKTDNKINKITEYCKKHPEYSGIVYCQTRKSVKELAYHLSQNGLKTSAYHGGMNSEERSIVLTDWLNSTTKIIVATNAFGMGIDKPDVRYVLHYEFPMSLEAYFQEAGRAGRDGIDSESISYWNDNDLNELQRNVENRFPDKNAVLHCYRALCSFLKVAIGSGKDETYPLDLRAFTKAYDLDPSVTYNSLKILEMNQDISFSEGFFCPTKVKFLIGNKELYNFQLSHEKFTGITTMLSRSYPGIFDHFYEINENELIKRLSLQKHSFKALLRELETYGVIEISWATDSPTVTFLHERLPDVYLSLSPYIYTHRKEKAFQRFESVSEYPNFSNERARSGRVN
ncbi:MAG: ATP-dependent DNA helicase [Cryomorphaceae bacterium]|nr:ATP-dependent DNA helicase [Cryomorphaceae bacterium]